MANKLIVVALLFVAIVGINAAEAPGSSPSGAPVATPAATTSPSSAPKISEAPIAKTPIVQAPIAKTPIAKAPSVQAPAAESLEGGLATTPSLFNDIEVDSPVATPETPEFAPMESLIYDDSGSIITVKISSGVVAGAIAGFFTLYIG